MMAIRAVPDDYDRWAASGCPGWSYADMLPYLRRMESDADFGDLPYHGADGPIPVQRLPREAWGPADNALAEAALGLGYPWCDDHNAPTATGVAPFGLNARDGARVTTNDAYLEPARDRPNLRVLGGATVDRVHVEAGRATGVRVRVGDDWIDVRAEAHRAVRRRDPLAGDPAALGHRPRRPRSRGCRWATACRSIRSRCSGSSRARRRNARP